MGYQTTLFREQDEAHPLLCLAGILLELTIDKVDGSCLQNTPCGGCGRGARCVFGNYCTAFCITATIVHEERFRKYCPRIGQPNPFLHQFSKRSVSRSERSADPDMMEIEYKVPFLDMLDEVENQIKEGWLEDRTAIVSMFTEIAEDVEIDAENCDTSTNALAGIADAAKAASRATVYSRDR